jgi:hypothetical protein
MRLNAAAWLGTAVLVTVAATWASRNGERSARAHMRAQTSLPAAPTPASRPARSTDITPAPAAHRQASGEARSPVTGQDIERDLADAAPGKRDLVLADSLTRLIERDPQAAARYAEAETDSFLRELALRVVVQRWAVIDADAAQSWAMSLGNAHERETALANMALGLGPHDAAAAVAIRDRHTDNTAEDPVLAGLVQQWAGEDAVAAFAWVQARPSSLQRDQLMQVVAFARAESGDFDHAVRIAQDAIADPRIRREALASVAVLEGLPPGAQ